MEYNVQTVLGPRTASVNKEDALVQLQTHPDFPKGAIVANFDEQKGQWVAKLRVPKVAAPPSPFPPSDDAPEGPPAPPDGPPKDEGDSEEGPPTDDAEKPSEDGPPKGDEGKPEKPNLEHSVAELTSLVHQIADALGVAGAGGPPHPGAGPDVGDVPPPPGGPGHQGPGRPPSGPGGQSAMMRARPLKPGEAPNSPGVTPVGAPAFASVQIPEDHPWKDLIGKTASFTVTSEIAEDEPREGLIARSKNELEPLAEPYGLEAVQIREGKTEDGKRAVKALIRERR